MDFSAKLKQLPDNSGVYLMMDEAGEIIYVGKARSLKNRVRQYFQSGLKTAKTAALVSNIADFRYIITNSEVEALVLENNLIKKYNPKYNILLKDDKSYPFIRIDVKQTYPTVEVTRKLLPDGAKYFGPYMQGVSYKDVLELIYSAFKLRSCTHDLSKLPASHRPCLNAHIGRCYAPCAGKISPAEYRETVEKVISFLRGNNREVKAVLEDKMLAASAREDYESALGYRDKLTMLERLVRKQVADLPQDYNLDVFAVIDNGLYAAVSMLVVRGGKLLGGDNFPLTTTIAGDGKTTFTEAPNSDGFERQSRREMLSQFIYQFYQQTPSFPDEIVINEALDDENTLSSVLSDEAHRRINIVTPIQGVRKQLVTIAENNALDYLSSFISRLVKKDNRTRGAVLKLADELRLPTLPERIECYDISHISGTNMVASMVVFVGGEPAKKMYRHFKIKTVESNNDFACMRETLLRRLTRLKEGDEDASFGATPDLIIVDGGKGQLSYALDALRQLDMEDLNIVSLAKREEEVFVPNQNAPIIIGKNSPALQLIQRVRDEAHRFAISYHRNLRISAQTVSILSKIEGIGERKINALYTHFKSLDKIKKASVTELSEVSGISKRDADNVYHYFHDKA